MELLLQLQVLELPVPELGLVLEPVLVQQLELEPVPLQELVQLELEQGLLEPVPELEQVRVLASVQQALEQELVPVLEPASVLVAQQRGQEQRLPEGVQPQSLLQPHHQLSLPPWPFLTLRLSQLSRPPVLPLWRLH